jgi:NADH-quinone oxidoreductase subunit E
VEEQLDTLLSQYKGDSSKLILILQQIQSNFGFLPKEAMVKIAQGLHIPESQVYGVATFYNQFRFTPLGKYPIKVCMGTACHLAGGKLVLEAVERELEIKVGDITPNGKFSLERVACIGCCALAPVMVIGEVVHPRMSPLKVEETLIPFKA